jgi:hypothetical protein
MDKKKEPVNPGEYGESESAKAVAAGQVKRAIRVEMTARAITWGELAKSLNYTSEALRKTAYGENCGRRCRAAIEGFFEKSFWPADQTAARRTAKNYDLLVTGMQEARRAVDEAARRLDTLIREAQGAFDVRAGKTGNIGEAQFLSNAEHLVRHGSRGRLELVTHFRAQFMEAREAMRVANASFAAAKAALFGESDRLRGEAAAIIEARLMAFREVARADFAKYFSDTTEVEALVMRAESLNGLAMRLKNLGQSNRDLRGEFKFAGLFA